MGFHYTIRLVADGQYGYGNQLDDGSWTGLVGDLVNHVGHIYSITVYNNDKIYLFLES